MKKYKPVNYDPYGCCSDKEANLSYALRPGRFEFLMKQVLLKLPHGDAVSVITLMEKAKRDD